MASDLHLMHSGENCQMEKGKMSINYFVALFFSLPLPLSLFSNNLNWNPGV